MTAETTETAAPAWIIHTDGSALGNPGPAGWAISVQQPDGARWDRWGSARKSTNNRCELKAVLEAVLAIPLNTPGVIVTDSEYVFLGCTQRRASWVKRGMKTAAGKPIANPELWVRLWEALDARPHVRLEWTRAHVGTEENERADSLARDAAMNVQAGGPPVKEATKILAAAA